MTEGIAVFEKIKTWLLIAAAVIIAAGVIWHNYDANKREKVALDLRNALAKADTTHQVLQNSYTRLVEENSNLRADKADMRKLLDQQHQALVSEQQVSLGLKKTLEFTLQHQPKPPDPKDPNGGFNQPAHQEACSSQPKVYTASEDIGFLKFRVDTFTVDPSYQQKLFVDPGAKPLQLTLSLTRDKNKQWHYYVTPSDPRVTANIDKAVVNLEPLGTHWYERLWIDTSLGVSSKGGAASVGASYEWKKYKLGPYISQELPNNRTYGINFSYASFKSEE